MHSSNDARQDELTALLADAAVRVCTFHFNAAEVLCRNVLDQAQQNPKQCPLTKLAQHLLKAAKQNKASYLYGLLAHGLGNGIDGATDQLPARAAGCFSVRVEPGGIVLNGRSTDIGDTVYLFINELLVGATRSTPPNRQGGRKFRFKIRAPSLSLLPPDGARFAVSSGERLIAHESGENFYWLDWPQGIGGLEAALIDGAVLTKHGSITPPPTSSRIDGWLTSYRALTDFLTRDWGRPAFLDYGTLLGAVRENRIIPHDDDLDVGYLSRRTTTAEVRSEMLEIISQIVAAIPGSRVRLSGFFFKFAAPDGLPIDVFPAWHDGHHLWSPPAMCLDCAGSLFEEMTKVQFHGHEVLIPARAEEFLTLYYGDTWRIPDPAYRVQRKAIDYPFRAQPFTDEDRIAVIARAAEIAGGPVEASVIFANK